MGIGNNGDDIYMITEYIEGGNLWKVVKSKTKNLSWITRLSYALDVAKAMAYLHAKRIIHRDLKCENLLLDRNGRVKVCDFGLCRTTDSDDNNSKKYMTKAGTEDWMAPEVILGNPYAFKADVFSFGVVLFELITRSRPPERHPMDSFGFDMKKFVSCFPKNTPEGLANLCSECVSYNSDERPTFMVILVRLKTIYDTLLELKQMKSQTSSIFPPPPPPITPTKDELKKKKLSSKKNSPLEKNQPTSPRNIFNSPPLPPPIVELDNPNILLNQNSKMLDDLLEAPPPLVFKELDKEVKKKKKKKLKTPVPSPTATPTENDMNASFQAHINESLSERTPDKKEKRKKKNGL